MVIQTSTERLMAGAMPKITVPCMSFSIPRRTLFARLDQLTSHALIWIAAPAGYGKTTTVSRYLRARRRPTVWYRCDEGEADLASFFHYVTLARTQLQQSAPMPAFLPQDTASVATFCRQYFRDWFAGLPLGTALVLDNWQNVPAQGALRALLPIIAEQLPNGVQLIVLSREKPDACVSRLIVGEQLAQLGVEDFELSKDETQAFALSQRGGTSLPPVDIETFYQKTQGWVTAVTLLMRQPDSASPQSLFDYLAVEVFERLALPVQEFLMDLACLEHFTLAVAQRVSGHAGAGTILESLTRQNAFIFYRAVSNRYSLHPLFRGFLQRRQLATRSADRRRSLLSRAALALAVEGEAEAGINLLIEARSWSEAAHLIHASAPTCVDQQQISRLAGWLEVLPADIVADDAWLLYWRGVCRLTLDFPLARGDLESAYHHFVTAGNRAGQAVACAAILQHVAYTYLDYRQLLPWILVLERLLQDAPQFGSSRMELRVRASFMLALSQGRPNHPLLAGSVATVGALVGVETDIVSVAEGVSALLHFFSRFGRTEHYGDLDALVDRLLADPALPAIHRINLLWLHAYQLHSSGDPAQVITLLRQARELARREGLPSEDTRMRLCELQAQEPGMNPDAALSTFSELERHLRSMPAIPRAHFLYVRSIFELGCGNLEQALHYGEQALPLIRASHWYIGQALSLTGLAEVYCAVGRYEDAAQHLDECALITRDVVAPLVAFNVHLVRAELARCRQDQPAFAAALASAFSLGREQGYANGFHTSSQLLRRLVPFGIELGIERSYCRWVILKRRFKPLHSADDQWPWPVKIRGLGRLRIHLQEEELILKGKAHRKPIEILKLLIAHPDGIDMSRVMDELWGGLDGDAARNALDIALHRLRKLLRDKEAVRVVDGTVSLNKERVWLDTDAFERLCSSQKSTVGLPDCRDELLSLYRGRLLGDEPLSAMMLLSRERLSQKFIRCVSRMAKELATSQRGQEVASWYQYALEREPTCESLHHEATHALLRQDRATPTAAPPWESLPSGSALQSSPGNAAS